MGRSTMRTSGNEAVLGLTTETVEEVELYTVLVGARKLFFVATGRS